MHASARENNQRITLTAKDVPIQKVFKEIRRQTGYTFIYIDQQLEKSKKVSVVVKDASLKTVLDLCFDGQPFQYEIKDKVIIVRLKSTNLIQTGIRTNLPRDIKGRVVDDKGDPVSGATVSVQGSSQHTLTDANGEFAFQGIGNEVVLVITHIQYEPMTLPTKGNTLLTAIMQLKIGNLEELQVIAYGTTSKRLNTGNVTTIKAKDIAKQPVNNPLLALQGRVPGLLVTQSTGIAGSGITVRIQGQNSLTKGNDPLYVIDGVPYISQFLPNMSNVLGNSGGVTINDIGPGGGNPLSLINPNDIESIEILKDADATSIYGSRAANGAILITTKKGKAGKMSVDLGMQKGWGKVARFLDLLNTKEYLQLRREAKANDSEPLFPTDYDMNGFWDTTRNTNWQKELFGTAASYSDATASISGGSSNMQYLVGMGYHKETSVFPGSFSDEKASLHFNINGTSPSQKFKFQLSGNYLGDNNRITSTDLTSIAINMAPNAPALHDAAGNLNWAIDPSVNSSTWTNPLSFLLNKYTVKANNLVANSVISYNLFTWLDLRSNFGYTNLQTNEIGTSPLNAYAPELRPTSLRMAGFGNSHITSWIAEPQLLFHKSIGKGKMELLTGLTLHQNRSNSQLLNASGFNSDLALEDVSLASTITPGITIASKYSYNAFFGRLNYNWQDKYIINLTARRDGSSRFGPENLFHNFGSVAGAWIFTNESFVKNNLSILSFGKLRASYGTTGSDQIGDYQFMNLYSALTAVSVPYENSPGLSPNRLTNPFLQWEETKKLQFGLDLGFWNNRIVVAANYFINRSSNQLLTYNLPIIAGFDGQTRNLDARIQNTGLELSLNANLVASSMFNWSSSLNVTLPKNKLLEYPGLDKSGDAYSYVIGEPITIQRAFRYAGVNSTTGLYQFYNSKGDLTSEPEFLTDNTLFVNTSPTIFGGFENIFRFKGLELNVLFQFVKQNGRNYFPGNRPGSFNVNQPDYVLDRWRSEGDMSEVQKASTAYPSEVQTPYDRALLSNLVLDDASFVRLKNISISYSIPSSIVEKIKLKQMRLYLQGQNIATITNYKGLDPETQGTGNLPPLRVITAGIQLTL